MKISIRPSHGAFIECLTAAQTALRVSCNLETDFPLNDVTENKARAATLLRVMTDASMHLKYHSRQRKPIESLHGRALILGLVILIINVGRAGAQPFAYVANSGSNNVSVINLASNTVMVTVPVGVDPKQVAITPDGTRAYVTNAIDNSVSVINTQSNAVVATVPVGSVPNAIAISPDGSRAYVANTSSNAVSVIDTSSNTVVATIPVGTFPEAVATSPDGTRAFVAVAGLNEIALIDTTTNVVVATVPVGSSPQGVAITPDGTRAYVTNSGSNNLSVIDTRTSTVVAVVPVGIGPQELAITPDGTRAYVADSASNTVTVISTASNTVVATVTVGSAPISAPIGVAVDGTRAYVTTARDNAVAVIDLATNTVVTSVPVGALPVGVAITPGTQFHTFTCLTLPSTLAQFHVQLFGINNLNQVTGITYPNQNGTFVQGFVYDKQSGTYTAIVVPGFAHSQAFGINDLGDVVGDVSNGDPGGQSRAFKVNLATLDHPTVFAQPGSNHFYATGINNKGDISGTSDNSAFVYLNGTYTPLSLPGGPSDYGFGLNNYDEVVGQFLSTQGFQAFSELNGTYTPFTVPGSLFTNFEDVNDAGTTAGQYVTADEHTHGFVLSNGTVSTIDVPGGSDTWVDGINNNGVLSGFYTPTGSVEFVGFIAIPGLAPTSVPAIVDSGASTFTQGDVGRTFTITVNNTACLSTSGTTRMVLTLSDPTALLPTGITPNGWTCSAPSGSVTCTNGSTVAAGSSFPPVTLTISVAPNAATPQILTVMVSNGGSPAPAVKIDTVTILETSAAATMTAVNANATATFSPNDQNVALSATVTSSGGTVNAGTVTFAVSQHGIPVGTSVSSGTVSNGMAGATFVLPGGTAVGTYTITATYNAGGDFAGSRDNTHALNVNKAPQTITFLPLQDKIIGTPPLSISSTASSGLSVSFSSTTPSVCSVSGSTVTLLAVGLCSVLTTQAGNTNYSAATPVTQSFQIYANVSANVRVTQNGFARNRATGMWSATMTVTNVVGSTLGGPIQVVFTNLSSNAMMTDATGFFNGAPYITVSAGTLGPGGSISVLIQFTNPSNGFIAYTPITYSGVF